MDFTSIMLNLNNMGFFDVVLPWILFLVIFFVIIQKAPFIEGAPKGKQIAVIISAVLAFFSINIPVHGIPLGRLLSTMFGQSGIFIAAVLVILIFVGMAGIKLDNIFGESKGGKIAVGLVLALLAILVLGASGFPLPQLDETTWTLIFVLVLLGSAVLFLGGEDGGGKPPKTE